MSDVEKTLARFSADARMVLKVWLAIRRDELVPDQARFDPMALAPLLGRLWIYRFEPEVGDFVCRLAGEDIHTAWGRNIKGETLCGIVGVDRHPDALARWRAVIETPRIQHGVFVENDAGDNGTRSERLVLPMSGGGAPDRVLGFSDYPTRQTDHNRTPPVWDDVSIVDCRDL